MCPCAPASTLALITPFPGPCVFSQARRGHGVCHAHGSSQQLADKPERQQSWTADAPDCPSALHTPCLECRPHVRLVSPLLSTCYSGLSLQQPSLSLADTSSILSSLPCSGFVFQENDMESFATKLPWSQHSEGLGTSIAG